MDTDEHRREARQLIDDADFDGDKTVDGKETVERVGRRIFDLVVLVADGDQPKSEELGTGDHEFVPWQIGAVM